MGTVGCERIRNSAFLEQLGRAVEPSQFWSAPAPESLLVVGWMVFLLRIIKKKYIYIRR